MAKDSLSLADLSQTLKELMRRFDVVVGDISKMIDFKDGDEAKFYEIVARASVIRQREAIESIVSLCENGHAAFAVCFLRPAYEEMLWMMYLGKNPQEAPGLSARLTIKGVGASVAAQSKYLSPEIMRKLGFADHFVANFAIFCELHLSWLRGCGRRLGWRKNSDSPTIAHIAQNVGLKDEYDFIYHATSRFVHFSPEELCRRAWGNREGLTISSTHFADHWGRFAIYWSTRIYVNTLIAVMPMIKMPSGNFDSKFADEIFELIGKIPPMPIITVEELEWVKRGEPPVIRSETAN
ncbi:MAG: DUF5677 domain-containing protein [Methylorubrum rhodinum]|uniref:DUF5677 domain-containing protein n=1 Tax=Methylorubrum rhodinum TaxID=29428 RepID=UPI003BB0C315